MFSTSTNNNNESNECDPGILFKKTSEDIITQLLSTWSVPGDKKMFSLTEIRVINYIVSGYQLATALYLYNCLHGYSGKTLSDYLNDILTRPEQFCLLENDERNSFENIFRNIDPNYVKNFLYLLARDDDALWRGKIMKHWDEMDPELVNQQIEASKIAIRSLFYDQEINLATLHQKIIFWKRQLTVAYSHTSGISINSIVDRVSEVTTRVARALLSPNANNAV